MFISFGFFPEWKRNVFLTLSGMGGGWKCPQRFRLPGTPSRVGLETPNLMTFSLASWSICSWRNFFDKLYGLAAARCQSRQVSNFADTENKKLACTPNFSYMQNCWLRGFDEVLRLNRTRYQKNFFMSRCRKVQLKKSWSFRSLPPPSKRRWGIEKPAGWLPTRHILVTIGTYMQNLRPLHELLLYNVLRIREREDQSTFQMGFPGTLDALFGVGCTVLWG